MPMRRQSRSPIAWWMLNTTSWLTVRIPKRAIYVGMFLALTAVLVAQQPVSISNIPHVIVDTAPTTTVTGTVAATQSGTWTVQPGNTANTIAWKVDGSAVTQPVNGTVTANMGTVTADPFGANADAASATGSLSAKLRFIASTGIPITGTVTVGSHAVTNAGTFAVQPTANASVNNNQWNGAALASPDANSYIITPNAATATAAAAAAACNILATASTNATSCKGSSGNFYGYEIFNTSTTVYYLRLYNTSSAPTCSSATGFIRSIPIPPAAAAGQVGGAVSNQVVAAPYTTGIGYCITGGSTSTDNTNAAAGIFGEIRYK